MSRKFLAPALVLTLCIGITMTAYAFPQTDQLQNQPQFTTNATSEELSIIKTLFSAEEYAELYPDVVKAHGNEEAALWNHFVTHGLSEGRALSKSFHVFAYRAAYQDLQEAFGNDLIAYYIHYATHGMQENRSVTTVSQAVNAGITVTGLRGQVIAKPVPVEITPAEDTNHEETGNPVAIPETPSPEPVPAPPVTVCTHQYIIKGLENTALHALVCELCGDIDESSQETCTADGYEADLMYHYQKCQTCNRIMFTQTHEYADSKCTICEHQCEHKFLLSSYDSEYHRRGCFACGSYTLEPHTTPGFCKCGYSS
ncbi:MAG: hypothetical protein Q4E29_13265 [Lachnospiraceae bacterium]|nr:hypothetical protein [Lachnospiraceae bacterium]